MAELDVRRDSDGADSNASRICREGRTLDTMYEAIRSSIANSPGLWFKCIVAFVLMA